MSSTTEGGIYTNSLKKKTNLIEWLDEIDKSRRGTDSTCISGWNNIIILLLLKKFASSFSPSRASLIIKKTVL